MESDEEHHRDDKGSALEQLDPGEVEAESTSVVLLVEEIVDIRQQVENVVKEVGCRKSRIDNIKEKHDSNSMANKTESNHL